MVGSTTQPEFQGASLATVTITADADILAAPAAGTFIRLYGFFGFVNVAAVQTVSIKDGTTVLATIGTAALGPIGFTPCPHDLAAATALTADLSAGTVTLILTVLYKVFDFDFA